MVGDVRGRRRRGGPTVIKSLCENKRAQTTRGVGKFFMTTNLCGGDRGGTILASHLQVPAPNAKERKKHERSNKTTLTKLVGRSTVGYAQSGGRGGLTSRENMRQDRGTITRKPIQRARKGVRLVSRGRRKKGEGNKEQKTQK